MLGTIRVCRKITPKTIINSQAESICSLWEVCYCPLWKWSKKNQYPHCNEKDPKVWSCHNFIFYPEILYDIIFSGTKDNILMRILKIKSWQQGWVNYGTLAGKFLGDKMRKYPWGMGTWRQYQRQTCPSLTFQSLYLRCRSIHFQSDTIKYSYITFKRRQNAIKVHALE